MTCITRRSTLQGLGGLAIAALPLSRAWADAGGPSLNFLAVGDWGREGKEHQQDVANYMGKSAQELNARFVISVGDNFYEDGVASVNDPGWEKSFEAVYTAPSLQVPWYVALGNHDYHGNAQAQLDYTAKSKRWRLPARWYKHEEVGPDGAKVALHIVDTSPMVDEYYQDGAIKVKVMDQKGNIETQLAWLADSLAHSKADWNIVVGHHPLYSGKVYGTAQNGGKIGGLPEVTARIAPILQQHRPALYLYGHEHDLQHAQVGATHYICTGAGSRTVASCPTVGTDFCANKSGFVACAANRSRLRVAYRDFTGAELHVIDIPRAG